VTLRIQKLLLDAAVCTQVYGYLSNCDLCYALFISVCLSVCICEARWLLNYLLQILELWFLCLSKCVTPEIKLLQNQIYKTNIHKILHVVD